MAYERLVQISSAAQPAIRLRWRDMLSSILKRNILSSIWYPGGYYGSTRVGTLGAYLGTMDFGFGYLGSRQRDVNVTFHGTRVGTIEMASHSTRVGTLAALSDAIRDRLVASLFCHAGVSEQSGPVEAVMR